MGIFPAWQMWEVRRMRSGTVCAENFMICQESVMKLENSKLQRPRHGGDIYTKKVQSDFSVNVNPLGIPQPVKQALTAAVLQTAAYPEYENRLLRETIARDMGLRMENVLCGNGASELFAAVVHALKPKKAVIPLPSFYGYEWACGMEHADVHYVRLQESEGFAVTESLWDSLTAETDMLFLANPANPVGNGISEDLLYELFVHCRTCGITVLLDECFIEFTGQDSAVKWLNEFPNLVVVRAFTKIYAVPGIRLGYLLAQESICRKIARQLPEWNVSVLAQAAGIAVYSAQWEKDEYIRQTVRFTRKERAYLESGLKKIFGDGITIFLSDANFLLLKTELPLYELLLEQGILIRDCSNYQGLGNGYYRIAVKGHGENRRLISEMRNIWR